MKAKKIATTYNSEDWGALLIRLKTLFGKTPDLNAILFLVGVQELGQGIRPFSKEEKQDLMHIAVCKILSYSGYYRLINTDQDGWPHWESTELLPFLTLSEQEILLKTNLIDYFEQEIFNDYPKATTIA